MKNNTKSSSGIILILFLGVLMGALDISIVGPAIPSIAQTIKMDSKALVWIFSIYVLFNLSGISLMAKLSDRFGRRRIYVISILIFAVGSIIVAFAGNYTFLLVGRAIQGFGSSGIFPVASAVIGDIYPPEKRGRALGLIGSVFGIAFMVGPITAGLMLKYLSWNYLFLINLPIASFVIWRSLKILPTRKNRALNAIDWKGIILLSSFLFFFAISLYAITPEKIIQSLLSLHFIGLFLFSVLLLILLVLSEKNVQDPVVMLSFFKSRQLIVVLIIASGAGIFQASFVFMPGLAVSAFGVVPSKASFMLIPSVIAIAIGAPLWGRLLDKFGSRAVIVIGLSFTCLGLLLISKISHEVNNFYVAGALFGFGLSALVGSSLRYIALNEVSGDERATSQGMIAIFISTGQIMGSVLIGVIAALKGKTEGFKTAFFWISVISLILIVVSFLLKSRKNELTSAVNSIV